MTPYAEPSRGRVGRAARPGRVEPIVAASRSVAQRLTNWRPPRGSLGIVALGQAGFALRCGRDLLLIDPFLSHRPERLLEPVVDPRQLSGVTAVLATHEHDDHLDLLTWAVLAQASPSARFVVPEPLLPIVTGAGVSGARTTGAWLGASISLGNARATPVPARHAVRIEDGYSLGDRRHGTPRFVGYVVELGGVRLYHAGDSLAHPVIVESVRALRPDIALLPINGRSPECERRGIVGNMSPDEAARLARDVGVAVAVPMHFDTIRGNLGRPDAFVRAMRRRHPTASVWVPAIGAGFVWPASARS
jgi:L-ascorbate metabolism protein UlaG (beta-lactamase superfamily)